MAASPPGALIEILVHLEVDEEPLPGHFQLLEIAAPDALLIENLTPFHKSTEACILDHADTRALGDAWLRSNRTVIAQVPSAILPSTWNYLLNPSHPDAAQVRIQEVIRVRHDERLFIQMRGR